MEQQTVMHYRITIKSSLDTVVTGNLSLKYDREISILDRRHMDQDKLDQIVFDLESAFNSRPDLVSKPYRVHIERQG